jgi:hypothetical protein
LEAVFVLLEFSSPSRRIFIGSHSLPPSLVRRIGPSAGTGLTGGAHRSDRCGSVDSRFGVPLLSQVGRLCVGS